MECTQIDLYEFLTESELQHYYNAIKNELKITNAAQFKYASDEDLKSIGLSRPEIRRLRKFYERHFPHGYLSKFKRLLQAPTAIVKREDSNATLSQTSLQSNDGSVATVQTTNASGKVSNNKHIIPADSISVNKQLGTGEFGIVQQGVWTNGTERIQVAIKCLCRERMQSNPMEFLKEAAIMHSIEHENIVRLYGVVLATDSLMLVTELAHLRSLLECLKDSGLRTSFLTVPTLCEFAMQICNGMRYLENKRLIHRDLAARNILVFSKNKVKISDFGLSRALGVGKDYYKTNFNVNLKLPIAWCAPECINYLRFTNASDVWAYGVCLWEMFSYGFQPWAALTGLQILEAIDAPNYQRLEQPDCCPREYYTLMIKCWQDDTAKRPKFSEIYEMLPDMKPEQLKTVVNCCESKKDHLLYRQGEILTVLDRNTGTPFWKGVLSTGKTGYFNPSNTVAYLEGLPCSNRDSFCRASERSSKKKLRTEMISKPQNDFKHTGHVGIDGDSFGDVAFLSSSQNYNHVQIVTPYKPSEDIEQTPLLLPPTPTSPDSLQTASGYFPEEPSAASGNPSFVSSTENTPKQFANLGHSSFEFPGQQTRLLPGVNVPTNPFAYKNGDDEVNFALQAAHYGIEARNSDLRNASKFTGKGNTVQQQQQQRSSITSWNNTDDPHEYHEISDDDITADKLDFGPSLLDEITSMFGSMSAAPNPSKSPNFEQMMNKSDFADMPNAKLSSHKSNNSCGGAVGGETHTNKFCVSKKKTSGTVKPISVKDEKILNQALDFANEMSVRSMTDLVAEQAPSTKSPKRKFSFRFPHLNGSHEKSHNGGLATTGAAANSNSQLAASSSSPFSKKKNFTEELQSIPDLQAIIGEEGREAYNSLIERKTSTCISTVGLSPATNLLRHLNTNEFEIATSKTLPRRSLHLRNEKEQQLALDVAAEAAELQANTVPLQCAPRPMTLPTRGATNRLRRSDIALSSLTAVRHSLTSANDDDGKENDNSHHHDDDDASAANVTCESPSYMCNNNFPKFSSQVTTKSSALLLLNDSNPIPLPPRDGKKHIKVNPKRHVRKYPLIIPANGVQRTLNKVTEISTMDDCSARYPQQITYEVVASIRQNGRNSLAHYENTPPKQTSPTYQNIERSAPQETCTDDTASLQFESILEADFNKDIVLQSPDVTDGFYNFSIQKENYNKSKGVVDFDAAKKISGLYANEDELRNLDMENNLKNGGHTNTNKSVEEASQSDAINKCNDAAAVEVAAESQNVSAEKFSKSNDAAHNELAGNALFKKVRESVDNAMTTTKTTTTTSTTTTTTDATTTTTKTKVRQQTEAEYFAATATRLANSNSVSCEDLLEFADKKPKGCERGVDSDEVRIMMKVLGKDCTPTRCLTALEFIAWDVHKAIKIIKLQNILTAAALTLAKAVEALQLYEWDLHVTVLKLKSLKA